MNRDSTDEHAAGPTMVGSRRRTALFMAAGLVVALVLAFGASRFAGSEPDGLEKVAAQEGLDVHERPHALGDTTFAGYGTAMIRNKGLGTGIAGVVGVLVTFSFTTAAVLLAVKLRGRARRIDHATTPP